LLPAHLDDDELCYALARAYRGAVASRTGKPCYLLSRGIPRNWKCHAQLLGAAKLMQELEIAPAAWAAWSVDVWADMGKPPKPARAGKAGVAPKQARPRARRRRWGSKPTGAPLAWVFSPERVRERWGWFRSEENQYEGGRTIFGPVQRALMAKYDDMRRSVIYGGLSLAQAAEQFFPGDTYDAEVAAAKAEIAENRTRLVRQAREGMFLW
jgi:hypothetical protein